MEHYYGYWDYDSSTQTMQIPHTGQSITYDGIGSDEFTDKGRIWHHFTYRDTDIEYPLYAQFLPNRVGRKQLSVDHTLSAQAWRSQTNDKDIYPGYWLWRRVNDCVSEALLLWPNQNGQLDYAHNVEVVGGWYNGEWRTEAYSQWTYHRSPINKLSAIDANDINLPSPLVPFDTPLPHKWTYYDIPASSQNAEITGLIEHNHRIFLPAGLPLTGFENLRPYLKRDDGGAVII